MAKKQPKKRKTREENINLIKETTLKMIEEIGYPNTSTNEIARRSGVNIGLLYRYFPDGKPSILREIGISFVEKLNVIPNIIIKDPVQFLNGLLMKLIKTHRERANILKAMTIEFLSNDKILEDAVSLLTIDRDYVNFYKKIFLQLGYSDQNDLEEKCLIILHVIDSMIHRQVIMTEIVQSDELLAKHLANLILKYLDLD
ncbi:MAG: TetR/AcrR family transcriptional regulator [Candidatus Hodarchaeota archaeon]